MKTRILLRGPVLSFSGYGEHARFILRALRSQEEKYDIHVIPTDWGKMSWLHKYDEEREWIDYLIKKTMGAIERKEQFDLSIQVDIPSLFKPMAPLNIGVTAGTETDKVSPEWIEKVNMMDQIITTSQHTSDGFLKSVYQAMNQVTGQKIEDFKCNTKVDHVGYPVKNIETKEVELNLKTDFNFFVCATWCARKNIENTLKWFLEEFYDNEEVGLVLKVMHLNGSNLDFEVTRRKIKDIVSKFEDRKCHIYLLHGDLSDEEMHSLYKRNDIKCLINLAHGEGFGLPIFEAAYSGLPVIAPNWGGLRDFMNMQNKKNKVRPYFKTVDFDVAKIQPYAVWKDILIKDSNWCYPKQGSYKMALRDMFKNYNMHLNRARDLRDHILEEFKEENQYSKLNKIIQDVVGPEVSSNDIDDYFNNLVEEFEK